VPLRTLSTRVRTARRPCGGGAPTFSAFRMVSCNIYRHSCSITLAKSNNGVLSHSSPSAAGLSIRSQRG
jgi:hypothetical protein